QIFTGLKSFLLHLQINFNVQVGGFNRRMAEPGANHIEINSRLQQMHGSGVSECMRANCPCEQRWASFPRYSHSMGDHVTQTMTRKAQAPGIQEKGNIVGESYVAILD